MKVRSFVAAVLVAALCASAAVAAPPPDKGKPATTPSGHQPGKPPAQGPGCRPQVTVVLKGTVAAVSSTQLNMSVTQSNRWGRVYKTAGSALVTLTDDTKVRRNGKKMLTDLAVNDWVLVQARVCKADLANLASQPPTLTAVRVVAHPAKA